MISVIKPGSVVKLLNPDGCVNAVVEQVRLRGDDAVVLDYSVIYWCGGQRYTAWVEAFEIELDNQYEQRGQIGFIT